MEQELLSTYGLRTLQPRSWADSIDSHATNTDEFQLDNHDTEKGYRQLLELVDKDVETRGIRDPVDPLTGRRVLESVRVQGDDVLKFSVASKQFNSKQFLKNVHRDASFEQLKRSLDSLESSIMQKNSELKGLIESEYLRFVKSKSALDGVLQQFQQTGVADEEKGLKELKDRVNDANKDVSLMMKPILSNKQREMKLKQSIEFVEKRKVFFNLPKQLRSYIQENDYDGFIHAYKQGKQLKESDNSKLVNRLWEDVEVITDSYKRTLWSSLNQDDNSDEFLKTIKKLMELDAIDNPILEWINLKSQRFHNKLNESFGKYHEKILNVQLNILTALNQPDISNLKNALGNESQLMDSRIIVEMWLMINKLFVVLRDQAQEFIKFWVHVENFTNGTYQQRLQSNYIDPSSSTFLRFERYEIAEVKTKGEQYVDQYIHKLLRFFNSTQESLKTLHATHSENLDGSISNFGFIPPFTNSLSTLKYLPPIAGIIAETLNDLGQLVITDKTIASLRDLSVVVNERIVGAVCGTWLNDCHNFYKVEDWVKLESGETLLPTLIFEFETFIIENMGNLLFAKLPEAKEVQIVKYPSKKILTGIQIQFLRSFDVLLESMIKKIIEENHDTTISKEAKDFHKLLTLFNIKKMSKETVPLVVEKYDAVFEAGLRGQKLEIYSILQKMEQTIFDSYMTEQRKRITKIITNGIKSTDWSNVSETPKRVSAYIYETVSVLIAVHTGVLSVSAELIGNVLTDLVAYASTSLMKGFREVTLFSMEGVRQVVLDVEFFKALVGKTGTSSAVNNLNLIYKNVASNDSDLRQIKSANAEVFRDALEGSALDREVFNS